MSSWRNTEEYDSTKFRTNSLCTSVSKVDILRPPGGIQNEYVTGPQSGIGEDTPPGAEESGVFRV